MKPKISPTSCGMLRRARSCGSRAAGRPPRAAAPRPASRAVGDLVVARQRFERHLVVGRRRLGEAVELRRLVEARLERREARKVERVVPPLQRPDRLEAMRLERLDQRIGKRIDARR